MPNSREYYGGYGEMEQQHGAQGHGGQQFYPSYGDPGYYGYPGYFVNIGGPTGNPGYHGYPGHGSIMGPVYGHQGHYEYQNYHELPRESGEEQY